MYFLGSGGEKCDLAPQGYLQVGTQGGTQIGCEDPGKDGFQTENGEAGFRLADYSGGSRLASGPGGPLKERSHVSF